MKGHEYLIRETDQDMSVTGLSPDRPCRGYTLPQACLHQKRSVIIVQTATITNIVSGVPYTVSMNNSTRNGF